MPVFVCVQKHSTQL